jgi:hypothetical protein
VLVALVLDLVLDLVLVALVLDLVLDLVLVRLCPRTRQVLTLLCCVVQGQGRAAHGLGRAAWLSLYFVK